MRAKLILWYYLHKLVEVFSPNGKLSIYLMDKWFWYWMNEKGYKNVKYPRAWRDIK